MADALTFDARPELGRARLVDLATESMTSATRARTWG